MKRKKLSIEETKKVIEQRNQELKEMLALANLPKSKPLSKKFINQILLEYLEACNFDGYRSATGNYGVRGELGTFNFSRKMVLREIIKEMGYEEAMNKLDHEIVMYQFEKWRKKPSRLSNFKYSARIFLRRHSIIN